MRTEPHAGPARLDDAYAGSCAWRLQLENEILRKHVEPSGEFKAATELAERLLDNIETVVRGKRDEISLVLCALFCRGHVLLEDVPGTAKTVLARAIAASIEGAHCSRVQCTPDLQPTDLTGLSIYNQKEREFEFHAGPIFAGIVLVDEINRAMPRTQSALLEAMAERQITVDGESRPLPDPFLILATQNPLDHEGTFPLPEAQLDRFFLKTTLGYPSLDDELRIVQAQLHGHPLSSLRPVIDVADLRWIQVAVENVYIDSIIQRWLIELVRSTRDLDFVTVGASVRGSLALERAARARALIHGRPFVEPEDVEALFEPVLEHRVLVNAYRLESSNGDGIAHLDLVRRCLELVPRPGVVNAQE